MDGQEQQFRAVHFHVTEGAQSQMMGGLPLLYVGITYHIAKGELEHAQQVFDETRDTEKAREVVAKVDVGPEELLRRVAEHGYQPLPDAVLERFDTIDSETEDMLVLLRVPCMPVPFTDDGAA